METVLTWEKSFGNALVHYLDDAQVQIDKNWIENRIRLISVKYPTWKSLLILPPIGLIAYAPRGYSAVVFHNGPRWNCTLPAKVSGKLERGQLIALLFGLVAERLSLFFEYGEWPSEGQSVSRAADWLARHHKTLSLASRCRLAAMAAAVSGQIEASVSREAGLFISHELNEALDPNYQSEIAQSVMKECADQINAVFADFLAEDSIDATG